MIGVFLIIFTLIFLLIVEILCILFKLTGLQDYKARFQVISILTGTGFTTKESELITQHRDRRRLAQWTMVLGYIGLATFIPFFMTLISNIIMKQLTAYEIVILIGFFILIFLLLKSRKARSIIDGKIENIIIKGRLRSNGHKHISTLLSRSHGFGVYTILVNEDCKVKGMSLRSSKLSDYEIIVLNVDRGDEFIAFPRSDLEIKQGDNIVIYGRIENIKRIFKV